MLKLKDLFNLEANIFPWVYALLVAVVMAFYLGASSYFEEDVSGLLVRTSRSRLAANDPDLRSLEVYEDRIGFNFNWQRHLIVYTQNGMKRRMLPADYTVHSGEVSVDFSDGINLAFRNMDDVFMVQATLPDGQSASLPWEINNKYELVQENPYFSYLREMGHKDPVFEVFSASGQTEITQEKILFKGRDTLTVRPYGGGRATLEEWLAKEQNILVQDNNYQSLRQEYYNSLFARIMQKMGNAEDLSEQQESTLLSLALLSGDADSYQQILQKMTSGGILDYKIAGFTGDIASALPSYTRYVQNLRTRISQAAIAKNRSIYAEPDLAAFLVNHRLTQAHEILVALTSEKMTSVSVYDLVNQLIFLIDSQAIRQTSAKEALIVRHLNQIIPYIVSLYQGLYLSNRNMEEEVFSTLPAIKLGSALLRLADAGFSEGDYAAHYQRIGLKLMETALTSFTTLGRIPTEVIFNDSLAYSKDSLELQPLRFMMNPRYETREHGRRGELASARYVLSAADHVEITSSTANELVIDMAWPAQRHQYFAVFGLLGVDNVSINQNDLSRAQSAQPGMNEWYFDKNNNVLFVNLYQSTDNLNIVIALSSPAPAPAKPAATEDTKEEAEKEKQKEPEKELSAKEKKKLEEQRKKEEKEQRKKEQQKKEQEEKR